MYIEVTYEIASMKCFGPDRRLQGIAIMRRNPMIPNWPDQGIPLRTQTCNECSKLANRTSCTQ
uniref:Uncharacterized protein n=1 Tax=Cannabis sativa TaxID=3483 RepID=A0A803QVF9_CANSA